MRVHPADSPGESELRMLSRTELGQILSRDFKDREWSVSFVYLTATPQHLSFHVMVGRNGKLKDVSPVRSWD